MICETMFKDCAAVALENGCVKIIILPSIGGKIASIYRKDKEFELLFQNKENEYRVPKLYESFGEYDASGFDDAFPTINECEVWYEGKKVLYPDHGEIWSANFNYECEIKNEKLVLEYTSLILKYNYRKIIYLEGDSVRVEYEIENYGDEEFPCIWAMHCLVRCEDDMELIFPKDTKQVLNVYESDLLGKVGQVHPYPITIGQNGETVNLNKIYSKDANKCEKYYVNGRVNEGYCGAFYPSKNVAYNVYFDKEKLPYLGFWATEGGFREDYNCALEPTNGYYDRIDIAKKEEGLFVLKAKEKLNFKIQIELK
jgi:galactose mutarotase-like enzyme